MDVLTEGLTQRNWHDIKKVSNFLLILELDSKNICRGLTCADALVDIVEDLTCLNAAIFGAVFK
jgi:hypothetical protein